MVDVAGMGRLQALGEARVAALREGILRAGLEQTVIWGRLKELGWDSMEVHRTALTGIKSGLQVGFVDPEGCLLCSMCGLVMTEPMQAGAMLP